MAYNKRATARRPSRQTKVPKSVKSYVKKQIYKSSELKVVNFNFTEATEATNMLYSKVLSNLPEGTGANDRIGNEVHLQGVQIKGIVNNNSTTPTYMRTIVLYAKDVNPISASSSIWMDVNGHSTTATAIGLASSGANLMLQPLDKSAVGTVLFDKVIKLSGSGATDGSSTKMYNHFIKLNNRKMRYPILASTPPADNLQVVNIYSESPQDYGAGSVVEHSTYYSTWYRDS